jgi:hypothetical protein
LTSAERFAQLRQPPIFVIGAARSGTTWVYDILTAHPEVAGAYESWLFTPANGLGSLFTEAHWPKKPSGLGQLLEREDLITYARQMAVNILGHAIYPEHHYLVEKSPSHIFNIALIRELFPDARFIHVIRDGRDVSVSVRAARNAWMRTWRATFGRSVRTSAQSWKNAVEAGQKQALTLGDHYLEVRYEALRRDPFAEYRRMFDFCGIPHDDDVLNLVHAKTDFEQNFRPNEDAFRRGARIGDWQGQFSLLNALNFNAAAGKLLVELGYEQSRCWLPSPAAALRAFFSRGFQQLGVRLDQLRTITFFEWKPPDHNEKKPKILVICGHPRSGTTLFTQLCNSHPDFSITFEHATFHHMGRPVLRYFKRLRWNLVERRGVKHMHSRTVTRLRNAFFMLRYAGALLPHIAERISMPMIHGILHDLFPSAKVVGDKHPSYIHELGALIGQENVYCVVLYRDCRDVVRSAIEMSQTRWRGKRLEQQMDTPEKVAQGWVEAIDSMEKHSGQVCAIQYESLVSDPAVVLQQFSDWLGVDPQYFNRKLIRQTSVGKHKETLAPEQLAVIEEIAGPTMRRLGYE